MNQAFQRWIYNKKVCDTQICIEKGKKKLEKVLFDKDKFIEAINNSENIFQVQSLSIFFNAHVMWWDEAIRFG